MTAYIHKVLNYFSFLQLYKYRSMSVWREWSVYDIYEICQLWSEISRGFEGERATHYTRAPPYSASNLDAMKAITPLPL